MKGPIEAVATFNDLEHAQAVKAKLERAGIEAKIMDNKRFQRMVFLTKPLACDRVMVKVPDFQKAREYLVSTDAEERLLQHEVHCLKCGSPNIDYPQFGRNFIMPTIFGSLALLFRLIDKEFYCRDCHFAWPPQDVLRPRTDILNWPVKHSGVVKSERG